MSGDLDDLDLNADGSSAVPAKDASDSLSAEPVVSSGTETLADSVNGHGEGEKTGVGGVAEVGAAYASKDCEGEVESSNGGVDDLEAGVKSDGQGVPEVEGANESTDCEGKVESSSGGVDDSEAGVGPVKVDIEILDLGEQGDEEERPGKVELNGFCQVKEEGATTDVDGGDSSRPVSENEDAETPGTQVVAGSSQIRVSKDEETIMVSKNLKMEIDEPKKVILQENEKREDGAATDSGAVQVQTGNSSLPVTGNEDAETPKRQIVIGISHSKVSKDEETGNASLPVSGDEDAGTLERQIVIGISQSRVSETATEHLEDQKMEIDEPKTELEGGTVMVPQNGKAKADSSDRVVGSSTKGGRSRSKFADSDLVWGKVRSYPWWPGQIFDTSAASDKAKKYIKKEGHLIVYFGDQSYAWNDTSMIKPFRAHFSQMVKQSKSENFHDAVDCILDEVARRVEFGLACPCVAEYNEIKTQVIVNPGIKDECCRRDGGDTCSSAASFCPEKLVEYIKGIGNSPLGGVDRLEFLTARSQVLAFSRWKGYSQLPELQILGTVVEEQVDVTSSEVELTRGNNEKEKKTSSSSSKRKRHSEDTEQTSVKKEKTLAAIIAERRWKGKSKSESKAKAIGKLSYGKKQKAADLGFDESGFDDSAVKKSQTLSSPEASFKNTCNPKKGSFGIGYSILKVASEMNGSSPILKSHSDGPSSQRTKEKNKGSQKKAAKSK